MLSANFCPPFLSTLPPILLILNLQLLAPRSSDLTSPNHAQHKHDACPTAARPRRCPLGHRPCSAACKLSPVEETATDRQRHSRERSDLFARGHRIRRMVPHERPSMVARHRHVSMGARTSGPLRQAQHAAFHRLGRLLLQDVKWLHSKGSQGSRRVPLQNLHASVAGAS